MKYIAGVLSFIVCASAALAQLQPPEPTEAKTEQPEQGQHTDQKQEPRPQEERPHPSPVPMRIVEPMPPAQESEATKNIQGDEAATNWWLMIFTGLMAFVATVQAGLFLWQLKMMRAGVADATLAAQAARDAADSAKTSADAFKLAQRAWVSQRMIANTAFRDAIDGDQRRNGVMLNFMWVNSGQTPAMKATSWAMLKEVEPSAPIPTFQTEVNKVPRFMTLNPSGESRSPPVYLFDEQLERLKRRNAKIFIYGRIQYEERFNPGTVRHTEICAELLYDGRDADGDAVLIFSPAGGQNSSS